MLWPENSDWARIESDGALNDHFMQHFIDLLMRIRNRWAGRRGLNASLTRNISIKAILQHVCKVF